MYNNRLTDRALLDVKFSGEGIKNNNQRNHFESKKNKELPIYTIAKIRPTFRRY